MVQGIKNWCSVSTRRGGVGRERGGSFRIEELYAYGQFVLMYGKNHQYCQVIILQLKLKKNNGYWAW